MRAVRDGVCNEGLQALNFSVAPRRVAPLHAHAVGVGLGQNLVLRHRAALPGVQVEQLVRCALVHYGNHLVRQVNRVMNPAVHAHAAGRAGEVRGVPGKQHPAGPVVVNQAAVDSVGADFNNLIGLLARHDALQLALDRLGLKGLFDRFVWVSVERAPPDIGQSQQ